MLINYLKPADKENKVFKYSETEVSPS